MALSFKFDPPPVRPYHLIGISAIRYPRMTHESDSSIVMLKCDACSGPRPSIALRRYTLKAFVRSLHDTMKRRRRNVFTARFTASFSGGYDVTVLPSRKREPNTQS